MSGPRLLLKYRALHQNVVQGNFNDIIPTDLGGLMKSPLFHHAVESQSDREDNPTRLLILSILTYLFEEVEKLKLIENQNRHVYIACRKLPADEALFMLLVEYIKSDNRFLIHASSKCLGSLVGTLDDEVLLKKRCKFLLEICQSTDASQERNIYFSIFSHILSRRNSSLAAKNAILLMLQINWEHVVNKTISRQSLKLDSSDDSAKNYSVDETMPLLILWKKIIKYEIGRKTIGTKGQSKAVTVLARLNEKPFLLLNLLEVRRDHLTLRKVFDILTTSFGPYEFMDQQQEQCCCLAESFLEKVLHGMLESLPNNFHNIGFGGSSFVEADDGNGMMTCDFVLLRKVCLAVLKCAAVLNHQGNQDEAVLKSIKVLEVFFQKNLPLSDASLKLSIFHLFVEQDDGLVAAILLALFIHQQLKRKQDGADEDVMYSIQPHEIFLEFLENVSFDHSILLDYLTSPETCFLTYLTKYLQLMSSDWDRFMKATRKYSCKLAVEKESDRSADIDDSESNVSCYSQDSKLDGQFREFLSIGEKSLSDCPGSSVDEDVVGNKLNSAHSDIHSETTGLPTKLQGNVLGLVAYSSSDSDSEFPSCESTDVLNLEKIQLVENKLTKGAESDGEFKIPTPCSKLENLDQEKEESMSESSVGELSKLSADDLQEMGVKAGESVLSNDILDQTMTTLIRLRMAIERLYSNELFPYNPTVLLNLIETCEDLYEN